MKKKLFLGVSMLLGTFFSHAQTKTIAYQELKTGIGLYFGATMTADSITVTFAGPSTKWIGLGFGTKMGGSDALIYTSSGGTQDWWDYYMGSTASSSVVKDASQDWKFKSNTVVGTLRTVVATRKLNTGDAKDAIINFNASSLNLIWARGSGSSYTLADHGVSNRGYGISLAWVLPDLIPPTLTVVSPLDNAIAVTTTQNLTATFSENIAIGSGTISLFTATNTLIETFTLPSSNVTVNGTTLTINPTKDLVESTSYYVQIANTAIKDLSGNTFAGITDATTWNFTTGDFTSPLLLVGNTFNPADEAVKIPVKTNLTISFNENIALGTGLISLKTSNGTLVESFDVASSQNVSVNGVTVTINPTNDLLESTAYYVQVAASAIKDLSGNTFAGINDATTWNFTTGDFTAPVLGTPAFSPLDNSINVLTTQNLLVKFNENIALGTGLITLKLTDGTVVESFNVATSTNITVNGNTVTINPTTDLLLTTGYYITIEATAVKDLAGNFFSGFLDVTSWNFTTIGSGGDTTPPQLDINPFTPADNSTNIATNTALTVNFNEAIAVGSGSVSIYTSNQTLVEQIDILSNEIIISGTQLIIHPKNTLLDSTAYYILITPTAIKDLSGNFYAGISSPSDWNFTTAAAKKSASLSEILETARIILTEKSVLIRANESSYNYQIVDLQGNILRTQSNVHVDTLIDLTEFKPAVYFITFSNGSQMLKQKFVVQ